MPKKINWRRFLPIKKGRGPKCTTLKSSGTIDANYPNIIINNIYKTQRIKIFINDDDDGISLVIKG